MQEQGKYKVGRIVTIMFKQLRFWAYTILQQPHKKCVAKPQIKQVFWTLYKSLIHKAILSGFLCFSSTTDGL